MVTQPSKRASRLSTASIQASVLDSLPVLDRVEAVVMLVSVPERVAYH